jgi:hypothetical protein
LRNSTFKIKDEKYRKTKIVEMASAWNGFAMLVFIGGIAWLLHFLKHEVEEKDEKYCTASDYTVLCYTLPKDQASYTTDDLKRRIVEYFEPKFHRQRWLTLTLSLLMMCTYTKHASWEEQ